MKIIVGPVYYCGPIAKIELPDVTDFGQIKDWFVKWDTFHYSLDGETYNEINLGCDFLDSIDIKRPASVIITDANANALDDA